jgi:hypothetical protein
MIFGMSIQSFVVLHVVISLIGIAAGSIVLFGMFGSKRLPGWTALFLLTTVLTSVTGFMFPISRVGPPHIVGAISLVVLAVALLGLYAFRLAGPWRWIYAGSAVLALYLNVFVGVVQAFQKLPGLQELAPTQTEPPFVAAQLAVLVAFVLLGIVAAIRFRPAPGRRPTLAGNLAA